MDRKRCYIYTRVSTAAQVDGYSLAAQEEALRQYAEYRDLEIANEYCDAGISGGSVEHRISFQKMISDIVDQKDNISFVLVFKLSRFGRNSADVLKYMQLLQDYDIDLVSVNESIDSSTQSGKMMLTIMSAVAEIEKENITSQFLAGKYQKFLNGGWYGGSVPFGYRAVNKELVIEKYEAEIVELIYNLYVESDYSMRGIIKYLIEHDYQRTYKGRNAEFTDRMIASILDNPVYCGKFLYNKRSGKGAEIIEKKGIHTPIISEDLWKRAQEKREKCVRPEKKWDKDRVSLLTGIIKCPVCGYGLVSVVSRSENKNHGGMYKPVYGYACKNRQIPRHKVCEFKRQLNQEKIDKAVYEIVGKIGTLSSFNSMLSKEFDNGEMGRLQEKAKDIRKQIYCLESEKDRIGIKMDNLDVVDNGYLEKYEEYEQRIDRIYDELAALEKESDEIEEKSKRLQQGVFAEENIKSILSNYQMMFDKMSCVEQKEFYRNLIDRIEVYPEPREDRRLIKSITFKFPVVYDTSNGSGIDTDNNHFVYTLDCFKIGITKAECHATYAMIKDYIKDKYGLRVSNLYIAQVKRRYGLIERRNYHVSKKENQRIPNCPKDKEKCIIAALRHFKDI